MGYNFYLLVTKPGAQEFVRLDEDPGEESPEEPTRPSFGFPQHQEDVDSPLQFVTVDQNIQNILRKPNIGKHSRKNSYILSLVNLNVMYDVHLTGFTCCT